MSAEALQIVDSNADKTITLNTQILRNILTRDDIKDRYVSVISITGTFRTGKSFLLNFLLRYLRVKYVQHCDVTEWLKAEDGPVSGFKWAPGSKRDTTGILMWSEIFLTQVPSGEEVAIILLDTQGSFDHNSSMTDCATIFALSTLMSSLQIYNISKGIKQYDLSHLQCFGGYGDLLMGSGSAPFQNLCFLVRDWQFAYEKKYGSEGGSALLQEIWSSETPDAKAQIEIVKKLFNEIDCFLMPSPGRNVETSNTFEGDLNEVDDEFKQYVQEFAPTFLSPENLILKKIGGQKVSAECLLNYIEEWSKVLKNGLPQVETLSKATIEQSHRIATEKALKLYKKNMNASCKHNPSYLGDVKLQQVHDSIKLKCIAEYNNLKMFNDAEISNKYLNQLEDDMKREFQQYERENDKKREAEVSRQKQMQQLRREEQQRRAEEERMRNRIRAAAAERAEADQGMSTADTAQAVGTAVAVIGGAAALAFGALKLFSSGRNNND